MEEILERQLFVRGRAFATFSTIEKALAGRKNSFRGPHAGRGPYVVQACYRSVLLNLFDVAAHFRTYQQVAHNNEATEAWKALRRVLTYVTRGQRTCLGFVEPTIAIQGNGSIPWMECDNNTFLAFVNHNFFQKMQFVSTNNVFQKIFKLSLNISRHTWRSFAAHQWPRPTGWEALL